ncbi:MAG: type II toxin-antitoxin system VapC family toxin [Verrucomicrobiota bacterium]|nr:type II toxin-antitoxin system VapC family toxin [Verrucomicrobiota bacterium]
MKILDTDTCIAILRGDAGVIERRRQTPERVVTTWITAGELFYGAAKSLDPAGNRALVERFLDTLSVLVPDSITAQFFGALKAALESEGRRLADADLWIGAIARAHRAVVVTGNTRHFSRITGVQLENWR